MTRFNRPAADNALSAAARPLASWYTQGVSDGLGDRLLMFDNTDEPSLELLRFRTDLVAASGFEHALRARARELREFTDPAFPQVRAVETLEDGGLALVSTFAPGKRLSDFFQHGRSRIDPKSAVRIVRDLTKALAALHSCGDGIAHGCLMPERVVIAPDGRLMIVEHVLGAALNNLRFSSERHWRELGIIVPEGDEPPQLNSQTDLVQLGWIILSLLIGRRLGASEYPSRAESLVDEFSRSPHPRSPELVASLQRWLEAALRIKGGTFASALDAHEALTGGQLGEGGQTVSYGQTYQRQDTPRLALVEPAIPAPAATPVHLDDTETTSERFSDPNDSGVVDAMPETFDRSYESRDDSAIESDGAMYAGDQQDPPSSTRSRIPIPWMIAALLALVAVVEGIVLMRSGGSSKAPAAVVAAAPAVAPVTPAPVVAPPPEPPVAAPVVASSATSDADARAAELLAQAETRRTRGGVQIVSPIEIQVLEGERVLGSSADGPFIVTPGRHEWDLINTAVGFRERQIVEIKAGRIAKLTIAPPGGRVSINAAPWAQVSIDGAAVGETPLANVPLSAGEHQITFRHPQLGERVERVIVKSGALTRVSASFDR